MGNITFCDPNHTIPTATITPVVTGTGWLNLSNLSGEVLSEMARYPGVNPANTKFVIDLGTIRGASVFAMPINNAQLGDTGRIRFATDAGFTDVVADSGWKEFWGEIYPYGSIPWGHPCWIDGHPTAEQVAGAIPPWMYIAPGDVLGRYVEVALDFTNNTDGYVDIGRITVSPGITPAINADFGLVVPFYVDPSTSTRSKGGVQFADPQRPYLYTKMHFDALTDAELYGEFYEMIRKSGTTKPMFFIFDPDADPAILHKQCFMCTVKTSSPTASFVDQNGLDVEVTQTF